MELTESIESINGQLAREFGTESDFRQRWKISLAGEQFEHRWVFHSREGFELARPEVRYVPKYQYIKPNYYVLERLVPVVGDTDLVTKTSYEAAWTFEDRFGNYLPPRFDACKFVVETIYSQSDKKNNLVKYKDPNTTEEERQKLLMEMEEKLFGNETPVGDALCYKTGVVVPGNVGELNHE